MKANSNISKHSIIINGHKTSISLEPEFWECVHALAKFRNMTLSALATKIDTAKKPGVNLSSALRLEILAFYRAGGPNT